MKLNIKNVVAASLLAIMLITNPVNSRAFASHHSEITKENTKIKIDTKHNKISLYMKKDGKWIKVKTEDCCTGKKSATPKGNFQTRTKKKKFTRNGKDYKYVTYFKDNYAIHSTPYDGENYNNNSLGHSRSLGCVRVKPETAEWIYENVKTGTEIEIE